jgi:hypothetical protein
VRERLCNCNGSVSIYTITLSANKDKNTWEKIKAVNDPICKINK